MSKFADELQAKFGLTPIELARIIPLSEAEKLSSISADSLKRNHADKIRRLGPRRLGMRLGDLLSIGTHERSRDRFRPCALTEKAAKTAFPSI